jgi:hypothetical protein
LCDEPRQSRDTYTLIGQKLTCGKERLQFADLPLGRLSQFDAVDFDVLAHAFEVVRVANQLVRTVPAHDLGKALRHLARPKRGARHRSLFVGDRERRLLAAYVQNHQRARVVHEPEVRAACLAGEPVRRARMNERIVHRGVQQLRVKEWKDAVADAEASLADREASS